MASGAKTIAFLLFLFQQQVACMTSKSINLEAEQDATNVSENKVLAEGQVGSKVTAEQVASETKLQAAAPEMHATGRVLDDLKQAAEEDHLVAEDDLEGDLEEKSYEKGGWGPRRRRRGPTPAPPTPPPTPAPTPAPTPPPTPPPTPAPTPAPTPPPTPEPTPAPTPPTPVPTPSPTACGNKWQYGAVPGPAIDASRCNGIRKGYRCFVKCASGYVLESGYALGSSAGTYFTCSDYGYTLKGEMPVCVREGVTKAGSFLVRNYKTLDETWYKTMSELLETCWQLAAADADCAGEAECKDGERDCKVFSVDYRLKRYCMCSTISVLEKWPDNEDFATYVVPGIYAPRALIEKGSGKEQIEPLKSPAEPHATTSEVKMNAMGREGEHAVMPEVEINAFGGVVKSKTPEAEEESLARPQKLMREEKM